MLKTWHIGIDDTDSRKSMCTTYLATVIVDFLLKQQIKFLDFPKLIRLNPNIPYKTRGNGAVAITFAAPDEIENEIWKGIVELVKAYSDIEDTKTDPGLVFVKGDIPPSFQQLYWNALYQVLPINQVIQLLESHPHQKHFYMKKGRGLIGATAAIGADLTNDYTFEFIAYRDPNQKKSERSMNFNSIISADRKIPLSFNNYDYDNNQVMITPHGPDPVFCGIRGETSTAVIRMWKAIEILEPIHKTMIFRTNQHTHVHFRKEFLGHELTPYLSAVVRGIVNKSPRDYPGGHVIFSIKSGNKSINCAAYEPTKRFRKIIRELVEGDEVKVFGGVRPESENFPLTINLEELRIIRLTMKKRRITPSCPSCGATLSSAGRNQGFKCKKCDFKTQKKEFIFTPKNRKIRSGIRYVIPVCAQRHLTKPISRDLPLQFHLSPETDFQRLFYAFLEERTQLSIKNIQ